MAVSVRVRKLLNLLLFSLIVFVASLQSVSAQENIHKVQSLYIYNFAKYIKWNNLGEKFVVGIYASNEAFEQLREVLVVRTIGGKSFDVKKLETPEEASACHIVFIDNTHISKLKKIKDQADLQNTLVVTANDSIDKGAGISFVVRDSKLKFKINVDACKQSGLNVSHNLLALGV